MRLKPDFSYINFFLPNNERLKTSGDRFCSRFANQPAASMARDGLILSATLKNFTLSFQKVTKMAALVEKNYYQAQYWVIINGIYHLL